MKYYLYFHAGSANHGCEALVRSTASLIGENVGLFSTGYKEDLKYNVESMVELYEDTEYHLSRKSLKYLVSALFIKLFGTSALYTRFSRNALLSHVKKGDVFLSIGGDNYCYGATQMLSDLNILIKNRGAKTVLWGCSIDPELITATVAEDLKRYDLITVREPITYEAMVKAGVIKNVRVVADPAFLLDLQETELPYGFIPNKTIGLNLSPLILKYTEHKEEALICFFELVKEILNSTDDVIALIPHVTKNGNSDYEVLEPIFQRFKNTGRVILVSDQNCMQLKYIISKCRLFIGARTHSTIAAYSTFVPCLAIGYSVKSRGIAVDLFGTDKNYVLPIQHIVSPSNMINAYHWLEDHSFEIHRQLKAVIPAYQEKAKKAKLYLRELA